MTIDMLKFVPLFFKRSFFGPQVEFSSGLAWFDHNKQKIIDPLIIKTLSDVKTRSQQKKSDES